MLLLACDFDGTLYRQGTIAESDRAAVSRFRERGNLFGIVTGRGATTLFRELGKHPVPFDFCVLNNGALVLDGEGRELCRTPFPDGVRRQILTEGSIHEASHCALFDGRDMYVLEGGGGYWVSPGYAMPELSLSVALSLPVQQISLSYPDRETARILGGQMASRFGSTARVFLSLALADVVPAGVSKTAGVLDTVRRMGWHPERIIAAGDDGNDVDMLRNFEGYAMEGADAAVRNVARASMTSVQALLDGVLG